MSFWEQFRNRYNDNLADSKTVRITYEMFLKLPLNDTTR